MVTMLKLVVTSGGIGGGDGGDRNDNVDIGSGEGNKEKIMNC